jgi:8-oxo-(d)GTP phosphatase
VTKADERDEESPGEVRAAGGLVRRVGPKGDLEALLVHRPAYDDWSLPKGKAEPGEPDHEAARREVEEETGLRCRLGPELGTVRYTDRRGRPKVVRYWLMSVMEPNGSSSFVPNAEIDALRWCTVAEAASLLTYERDRALLREWATREVMVFVIRHAKAGSRSAWTGPDDLRPLTKPGGRQAAALTDALPLTNGARVVASPSLRCVETVEPLARRLGVEVERVPGLAEGMGYRAAFEVVLDLGDAGGVVCSHGDVIADLLDHLERHGVDLGAEPALEKGSAWGLAVGGDEIVAARYLPPPR